MPASSLAPTLHGGKPRSLRREGIVWPGIHHSLDKRNSKRAAPCRPRPSHAGHWTATYSCSLQSSTPQGPLTAVYLSMYLYRCNALYFPAHHASSQVTWPERVAVAVAVALPESEFRATRETARLEFHSKSATSKNSNHVSTHSLLRPPNRFSLSQASTCIMPRKATQDLKWAWLVPTITSAT